MNSQDVENHDVEKLHLESLQLRNQQFQLAAISLAGSGITAWIAPGLTALAQGYIPEIALVGGSLFWLVLLKCLYIWSLSLRAMIAVISQYLDVNGFSYWENHYRSFTEKTKFRFHRQTKFTAFIFTVYGIIATGGAFVAAWAAPEKIQLSLSGNIILLVCVVFYIVLVWVLFLTRNKNKIIREAWLKINKPTLDAVKKGS